MESPRLIDGGLHVDDRGVVRFVNDFDFAEAGIRRFYVLENHEVGYVRAWHGHRTEAKYMTCVKGTALVCAAPLDLFKDDPFVNEIKLTFFKSIRDSLVRVVLADHDPRVLYIPPDYANGFMALTPGTQVIHFSTLTLEESEGDDVRYPADALGEEIWQIKGR